MKKVTELQAKKTVEKTDGRNANLWNSVGITSQNTCEVISDLLSYDRLNFVAIDKYVYNFEKKFNARQVFEADDTDASVSSIINGLSFSDLLEKYKIINIFIQNEIDFKLPKPNGFLIVMDLYDSIRLLMTNGSTVKNHRLNCTNAFSLLNMYNIDYFDSDIVEFCLQLEKYNKLIESESDVSSPVYANLVNQKNKYEIKLSLKKLNRELTTVNNNLKDHQLQVNDNRLTENQKIELQSIIQSDMEQIVVLTKNIERLENEYSFLVTEINNNSEK